MRLLKLLIYGFFTLLILVFAIPLFLPDSIAVSQSIRIPAEARQVFRLVNNFENWKLWSPFELDNPDIEARITGAPLGEGSQLAYKSHTAGEGRITIIESKPYTSIKMMLGMQNGGIAVDEWTFEQQNDTVLVTWTLKLSELKYPFHRYFGFFSRSLMAPFQQKGLEKLRDVAVQMSPLLPVDTLNQDSFGAIVRNPEAELTEERLSQSAAETLDNLSRLRVMPSGDLIAVFGGNQNLPPSKSVIGFVVPEETRESGSFAYVEFAGGKAITTSVVGPLSERKKAYDELSLFMQEFRLERDSAKPVLEFYSPSVYESVEDATKLTRVLLYLKEKPKAR